MQSRKQVRDATGPGAAMARIGLLASAPRRLSPLHPAAVPGHPEGRPQLGSWGVPGWRSFGMAPSARGSERARSQAMKQIVEFNYMGSPSFEEWVSLMYVLLAGRDVRKAGSLLGGLKETGVTGLRRSEGAFRSPTPAHRPAITRGKARGV